MSYFLGVDGGGSKTVFLLIDAQGHVRARRHSGSAYYLQVGLEALRSMLHEGIEGTLSDAGLAPAALSFTCIGLPAYGEDSTRRPLLDAIATPLLPMDRCRCVNDMVCGWAGALAGRDGINVVAGTGSIGYGEYQGRSARAGGWGELFSDEGSAFWVAREALALFTRMSDGREPPGPLLTLLRERFALADDLDLCAAIYGPPALARSDLAALAPLVAQAARLGDVGAQGVFAAAGAELARLVHAIRDRLGAPAELPLPLSHSGGLFKLSDVLLPAFDAALRSGARRYEFISPRLSPHAGAALYAARLAGTPLSAAAAARLEDTGAIPT